VEFFDCNRSYDGYRKGFMSSEGDIMKPSFILKYVAKTFFLLFAAIVMPLFSLAQSNRKADSPPPPPSKNSPPTTASNPVQGPRTPAMNGAKPNATTPPRLGAGTSANQPMVNRNTSTNDTAIGSSKGLAAPPKAPGTVNRPDGGKNVTTLGGHTFEYGKTGHLDGVVTRSGTEAHYTSSGQLRTVKTANGTTIIHGPGGTRQVVTEHRDVNNHVQSRIVSMGSNRGYVEHTFQRGGHEYIRRTYVYGGRTYVNVYRGSYYHGVIYYHYVPAYYYHPVFYGWAYNPWPAPVYYTWGWYGASWYAPYGYYFAPYPAYASAAFWLTDYMIAESLRASYDVGMAQAGKSSSANDVQASPIGPQIQNNSVTLTPEVKQMIAEEVKAQLAAEQAAATQSSTFSTALNSRPQEAAANTEQAPPALDPSLRVFIVATNLEVTANGQTCPLSAGDVLMRTENTPDKDNSVSVSVVSSKKSDCVAGSPSRVEVADLQEMHNHFREQMDGGLKTLADNQGKNGLPTGPAADPRPNADGQSVPDLTATTDLQKQRQDAEQAEQEVQEASLGTVNGK
jgi:hypothetical protein